MKNVVFLFDSEWSLGSVHYELFKYLWKYGYNCQLLPWHKRYTTQELQELDKHIHLWVVNPHGLADLVYNHNISFERCAVVSHAVLDFTEYQYKKNLNDFNLVRKHAVTSNFLKDISRSLGIQREPIVCSLGINYNTFYGEPNKQLTTVGFASSYHEKEEFTPEMIASPFAQPKFKKRGYLVKKAAEIAGCKFTIASDYHNSFVTMPGFYKTVDCVIVSSSEEGYGLPLMEAGAAGKLVIGTPVGCWNDLIGEYGGIEVPINEEDFIERTVSALLYYKHNSSEYRNKCYSIREHAKKYDWDFHIEKWLPILE